MDNALMINKIAKRMSEALIKNFIMNVGEGLKTLKEAKKLLKYCRKAVNYKNRILRKCNI